MGDIGNVEKICGFYISSMHLITMILPYIKEQINKGIKIETILEYNLNQDIDNVLSNLIINEKEKEKILDINWNNNKIQKYSNFENKLNKILENEKEVVVLISGKRKYIEEANQIIDKFINKNCTKIKQKKIQIIDCYEVTEFDDNIKEILDTHQLIINTSGVHQIENIFEDYQKRKIN